MSSIVHRFRWLLTLALSLWQAMAMLAGTCDVGQLTRETGLSGLSANKIMFDKMGMVWIATSKGVDCFNGVEAELIPILEGNWTRDRQPSIFDICQSSVDQSIYCSTSTSVYRLGLDDNYFTLIAKGIKNGHLLCDGHQLYISDPKGLHIYRKGRLKEVEFSGDRNIHCMTLSPDGTVWMLTSDALCQYLPKEQRVERHDLRYVFPAGCNFNAMAIIRNKFYVGTTNYGLFLYDRFTGKAKAVKGVGKVITSITADRKGNVSVSTDGSGAYLIDGNSCKIVDHFYANQEDPFHLSTNAIYHYLRDDKGNNWFAQFHHGLIYSYYQWPLFHSYVYKNFDTSGMDVRSFFIDGKRRLIGTSAGLYIVDEQHGTLRLFNPSLFGGAHIFTGIVRYGNNYYVGTYDGGIYVINAETFALAPATAIMSVTGNAPVTTMATNGHRLWIGTMEGVVMMDDPDHFMWMNSLNSGLVRGSIVSIAFDAMGNTLLSSSAGLSIFNEGNRFVASNYFPKGFSQREQRLKLTVARDGNLYMANNNGIFYFSPHTKKFVSLSLPSGIASETCSALYADDYGFLWLVTEEGLFRLNKNCTQVQHFGYGEGLNSSLILSNGVKAIGDTLWVATSDGLMWMKHSDLVSWERQKRFHITLYDVRRNGQPLVGAQLRNINKIGAFTLRWNFISETFQAKALLNDFSKPEGRIYEYKIDDASWHLLRHGEEMSIDELFLGSHDFHVRLAGVPGTETTFTVHVVPSVAFIIEMVLLVLAIVLFFAWHNYHKSTKIMKHERDQIEDALIEMEHKEALLTEQQETAEETGEKYQQVKLTNEECADIVTRMRHYLETERAYTNPDLKRADISRALNAPVAKLSYVFTMYLKENYYEFVNHYRLEAFKQLISEGAYKQFTLTALSEQCGFKKTSFFTTFRKVEGMTPTEYLKRKNIKIGL